MVMLLTMGYNLLIRFYFFGKRLGSVFEQLAIIFLVEVKLFFEAIVKSCTSVESESKSFSTNTYDT